MNLSVKNVFTVLTSRKHDMEADLAYVTVSSLGNDKNISQSVSGYSDISDCGITY